MHFRFPTDKKTDPAHHDIFFSMYASVLNVFFPLANLLSMTRSIFFSTSLFLYYALLCIIALYLLCISHLSIMVSFNRKKIISNVDQI